MSLVAAKNERNQTFIKYPITHYLLPAVYCCSTSQNHYNNPHITTPGLVCFSILELLAWGFIPDDILARWNQKIYTHALGFKNTSYNRASGEPGSGCQL
jgi:hypothetical protein